MFFKIKKLISKLTCISLAISLGCSFSVPAVRADTSPYTEFEICNREGGMGNCGGQGGNYTHWAHRLDMFKDDILQAFKFLNGKRIIICSNDSAFLDNFKVLKPEFDIVHKDSIESVNFANYDYVIDTIYAPPFLQTVYKSKNVISFIEVYKSILYEKVLQFFKDNKIQYYFFEVPEKSKLKNLDDFEREMFSGKCPSNMEETREVESFSEILDKLFPDNQRCRDYLMNFDYSQIQHYNNGRYKVRMDGSNDYNNVVNGVRITPDMPENFRNKAHFFGTCTVAGHYVTDEFTVTNYMQKRINEHFADTYGVVNYGTTFDDSMNDFERMLDTAYKPGDVVININHKSCPVFCKIAQKHGIEMTETSQLFSRPHDHGYCMFDDPAHLNDVGNALIADFVYSRIKDDLARQIEISEDAEIKFEHVKKDVGLTQQTKELDAYVKSLNKIKLEDAESKNIGSIVMNCNPFTLGHRYLIEEALKRVDHLYIFVVQEDMSVFPFIDRIDLVKRGTSDLRNVTVLPSGSWIISTKTFPEYFSKERLQAMTIDPSIDVEIFGEHIAPALGIKIRFAGEEPLDQITRQYNRAMAEKLPIYGVGFCEIPRLEIEGAPISASMVRRLIGEEGGLDLLHKYVPQSTLDYLRLKKGPPYKVARSENPKVSVIIPIYNAENTLHKCLQSVVNQTLRDIEIICVNDGSKDSSLSILEQHAAKDERIIIIDKKNGGAASARNAGLDAATGAYLEFVDSDDWIDEKTCEINVKCADENNADIVVFGAWYIDVPLHKEYHYGPKATYYFHGNGVLSFLDQEGIYSVIWNRLYRRDMVVASGVKFNCALRNKDDTCFNLDILPSVNNAVINPEIYYYHIGDNHGIERTANYEQTLQQDRVIIEHFYNAWHCPRLLQYAFIADSALVGLANWMGNVELKNKGATEDVIADLLKAVDMLISQGAKAEIL